MVWCRLRSYKWNMTQKIHVAHILVQHRYEAEDILRKLQSSESSFGDLAKKFSQCPSAQQGGDLGLVAMDRLDSDFAEAAEILKVGAISPVVRTRFGYHLIQRL
jgi:peptidyl-prolyl cis-trans isomerase C